MLRRTPRASTPARRPSRGSSIAKSSAVYRAAQVVLAGFSQGGAIALHTALREPRPLAGVLALSTYLPLAATLAAERSAANTRLPIFMAHGSADPLLPLALAQASRQQLLAAGYGVDWHVYPMPHSVCAEEIAAIAAWLARRVA